VGREQERQCGVKAFPTLLGAPSGQPSCNVIPGPESCAISGVAWRPRHTVWWGGAGVPLALCGMGYRSWPMGNSKGLSRGEQRFASWGLVGRHGGQASVSQEVLTPGARGSRVTGMDRGLTPQCLCPSSATILPCYLGQDTFFLLASVYSFVSFGDLKFYPCWLQRKKILLLCCFTHTGQGSSILR
jgi:hypothetical protein